MSPISAALDLTRLTASDALPLLRGGELSVERYAGACLDRVALRDPDVHAWAYLDPERVLAAARALDRRETRGPLHGLPIGVKDIILTKDMPTQYNSEAHRNEHAGIDADCVAILRDAGALIFGKTHTVEFGATGRPPPTRNPRDSARTPGGSSSGSAAVVADGQVPLAIGTQTGGSIVRPASYCGVFGIKPTWGLVGRDGVKAFAPTLDTVGWFARSAADLARVFSVFEPSASPAAEFDLAGATIGLCRSPLWSWAEDATRAGFAAAAAALRRAGAKVVEFELPAIFAGLVAVHERIMISEGRATLLSEFRRHAGVLHPNLRAIAQDAAGVSGKELAEDYDVAAAARAVFDRLSAEFDAVLTPSVVGEPPLGLESTGPMTFNALWSLLHTPCVNVPGLRSRCGLPIGLTLTGPRFCDARLLSVAEAIAPWLAAVG